MYKSIRHVAGIHIKGTTPEMMYFIFNIAFSCSIDKRAIGPCHYHHF
jgi:hypothetical protein